MNRLNFEKLSFSSLRNDNKNEFLDFTNLPCIWFFKFSRKKPSSKWPFSENYRNSNTCLGWIGGNPGIHSQIFFSKYYLGSLCIVWQKETKLMSIYNTAISVIHWKFIRVRTRKVEMIFFLSFGLTKFQVGKCETKNFGFGSRWDFDSFTTWWNGTTNCSTTWFVKTWSMS